MPSAQLIHTSVLMFAVWSRAVSDLSVLQFLQGLPLKPPELQVCAFVEESNSDL